ncbi:MAG: phospholipase D-like domain-containing protein [Bacteroidales bacterium]|nr:phospholipase D-like domain-containing protein [Bacteroidales bacterium]
MTDIQFVVNEEIYNKVLLEKVPNVKRSVWIATADIKDLYVKKLGKMVPFLHIVSDLLLRGVEVRLIFAKEPGTAFQKDFDKYPVLAKKLEQFHCPRVHFKMVIIDGGEWVFTGSANLTGAGMGAKSVRNRNFENGVISTNATFNNQVFEQFDSVWMGTYCDSCGRKQYCAEWRDM